MIREVCAWVIAGVMIAGLAAPAFAQTTTPPAPAPTAPAPAPAPAPAAKAPAKHVAKMMHATGMVKSASADSLVLVTGKDKKEVTFALDKDTKIKKGSKAIEAKDVAENETATVAYTEADGKMVAKTVTVKPAKAAAKPAAKKS